MKYTEKIGLKKPEATDFADIADLNFNFDKIDEEVDKLRNGEGSESEWHYLTDAQLSKNGFEVSDDSQSLVNYLRYRKVNGVVYIQGTLKCPSSGSITDCPVFTLGEEYAPSEITTLTAINVIFGNILQAYIEKKSDVSGTAMLKTFMIRKFDGSSVSSFGGQVFDINISYPVD